MAEGVVCFHCAMPCSAVPSQHAAFGAEGLHAPTGPSQGAACTAKQAASPGSAVPRGRFGRLPLVWVIPSSLRSALPCWEGEVLAQTVAVPPVPAAMAGPWLDIAQDTGTTPGPQCDLQGQWRNEMGSNMTLSALDAAGTFSGSYHTAVADTNKQILVSPLQGAQQHPGAKGQPTFGFTVQWQFAGTAVPGTASQGSQ